MFAVDDRGDGFGLVAQLTGSVDPARVCAYMHTALASLADALEREPERRVRTLEVLPAAERRQIVEEWNPAREAASSGRDTSLAAIFEAQVRRTPDAPAVVFEDARLTYAALNRRANQLAHHLRGLGVRADTRVAIRAERSLELVIGLLAIVKAGAAYVPLDPGYPDARLRGMIADSAPVALLTDHARGRAVEPDVWITYSGLSGTCGVSRFSADCAAISLATSSMVTTGVPPAHASRSMRVSRDVTSTRAPESATTN
jgi:non-ribosomal peptide synthetase component F